MIEKRQGLKVAFLEEIACRNGRVKHVNMEIITGDKNGDYSAYLRDVVTETTFNDYHTFSGCKFAERCNLDYRF